MLYGRKYKRMVLACSPPLSAPAVLSQSGSENSYEKYFSVIDWVRLAQLKQPNSWKWVRIPPSWHLRRAQANTPKYLEGFQLWFDPGLQATEEFYLYGRATPPSLETRVHKILLCSFGHSTFTSITFYRIQRNLIQPCFKGRVWAFLNVFKKTRIFKAHLRSTQHLKLSWQNLGDGVLHARHELAVNQVQSLSTLVSV